MKPSHGEEAGITKAKPNFEYDAFISHAEEDKVWSEKLAFALVKAGFHVWLDMWKFQGGMNLASVISSALEKSRRFIPIMTPVYFAKNWTQQELDSAIYKENADLNDQFIIPVLRRDCDPPLLLDKIYRIDFRNDKKFDKSVSELVAVLNAKKHRDGFPPELNLSENHPKRGNLKNGGSKPRPDPPKAVKKSWLRSKGFIITILSAAFILAAVMILSNLEWRKIASSAFNQEQPEIVKNVNPSAAAEEEKVAPPLPNFWLDKHPQHPDSLIRIRAKGNSVEYAKPLLIKIDDQELAGQLDAVIGTRSFFWPLTLLNQRVPNKIRKEGPHKLYMRFADTEWSQPLALVFATKEPFNPEPSKYIRVTIERGMADRTQMTFYANHTGHLLSHMHGRKLEEILSHVEIKKYLTRSGEITLTRLLQNRIFVVPEDELKALLSKNAPFIEVRQIRIALLESGENNAEKKPLSIVLVFRPGEQPKLSAVTYDRLDFFLHLTNLDSIDTVTSPMAQELNFFFARLKAGYNSGDIEFLYNLHEKDVEVIVSKNVGGGIEFHTRDKKTYLDNLKHVLNGSGKVEVSYSEPVFWSIPNYPGKYIIEFDQFWRSQRYSDEGHVIICVQTDAGGKFLINRICHPFFDKSEWSQPPLPSGQP